jgi:hypothetical protein
MIVKTKAVMKRDGKKLFKRQKMIKGLSGGLNGRWVVKNRGSHRPKNEVGVLVENTRYFN